MLITNSRLRAFRRCPMFHELAYVQLIRPIQQTYPIRFGSMGHVGLERWWGTTENRLAAALRAIGRACDEQGFDEWERIKAEELIRGYDARWSDAGYETIAVEQEFSIPIENGDTLGGKFDVICQKSGRVFILDHKFTSKDLTPGGDYYRKVVVLDTQVSTYYRAAKELKYDPAGWVHDCILRVALRPYKAGKTRKADETPEEYRARVREDIAENPDKYYQRYTIVRTERDEAKAEIDLRRTVRHLKIAVEEGSYRNPDACENHGYVCEYFSVCEGVDSTDNVLKFRRASTPNEELNATH